MRFPGKKIPPRFTAGMVLPDGCIVELIRDHRDGLGQLMHWDPKTNEVYAKHGVAIGNVGYFVIDKPEDWLRRIRLPMNVNFGTPLPALVEGLCSIFLPLGTDQALLLAAWVLSTWKAELANSPKLFVRGPGAVLVLQALHGVCRRGIQLHAQSSLGTFPSLLSPTLLVLTNSPRLLQKVFSPGVFGACLWRGGTVANQSTALAAAYFDDAKPIQGVLNILAEVRVNDLEAAADRWQCDLLGWKLQSSKEPLEDKSDAADPVLRNLLIACSGDPEFSKSVRDAYARQLYPMQLAADWEENEAVIAALNELAVPLRSSLYVSEIARSAERKLLAIGSYVSMTPRYTGDVLRRLGIEPERLGALGRGVRLSAKNLARLKELTPQTGAPEAVGDENPVGVSE
jgi:hypothetical protein